MQSDPGLVQADWKHLRQHNALLLPQVKLSATCLWRIDCTRELCGLDFCGKIAFCSRNSNLVSSSTKQQGPGKKKDSNGSKSVPRPFASVIRMTSAAPDNRIHSESIAFQGIERKRGDNLRCTFERLNKCESIIEGLVLHCVGWTMWYGSQARPKVTIMPCSLVSSKSHFLQTLDFEVL